MHRILLIALAVCSTYMNTVSSSNSHHLRYLTVATNTADSSINSDAHDPTLCGEILHRQTGFLNGLYYVFYESTSKKSHQDIPVILWLSGGPGCSGLIAALFELGPCTFDDEADKMSLNPYAWTNVAHVIFVDQPKGTGFSDSWKQLVDSDVSTWNEATAMQDLSVLAERFFVRNPDLRDNDFYIMGESFAGHYVPDLAVQLLKRNDRQWRRLKGVAIGNGVVSPLSYLRTQIEFALHNGYVTDILNTSDLEHAKDLQARAIEANTACQRQPNSTICAQAADLSRDFEMIFFKGVLAAGHNMYDIRHPCHFEDPSGLCYWLSRLEKFVNQPQVLEYFGVPDRKWALCNNDVTGRIRKVDYNEESSSNVAFLLSQGIRVLVYAGDADSMAPWNMQKQWTHDMVWDHQNAFQSAPMRKLSLTGNPVGTVQTLNGLSVVRIYEAGHMVPHDQPEVAVEMIDSFLFGDRVFT